MSEKMKVVVAGVIAVLVLGGGGYALKRMSDNDKAHEAFMMQEVAMEKKDAETAAMKMKAGQMTDHAMKKDDNAVTKGVYTDYDYDVSTLANAQHGKVVLFFHAPWCPTCREANGNFESTPVPDGLTLLKVDYDSSNDLKKKYGVTYQHTFVQVDKDGKLLKKWSGSTNYDDIKAQEQ